MRGTNRGTNPPNAWNNPPKYVEQTVEQDAESRGTKGGIPQQSVAVPRYLSEVAGGVGAGAGACSTQKFHKIP